MSQSRAKTLTIATRKSPLAIWQAEHIRDRYPGLASTALG